MMLRGATNVIKLLISKSERTLYQRDISIKQPCHAMMVILPVFVDSECHLGSTGALSKMYVEGYTRESLSLELL